MSFHLSFHGLYFVSNRGARAQFRKWIEEKVGAEVAKRGKTSEKGKKVANDGGALSWHSASHVDALVASASSAALALPLHGVQGRLAWFAPWCRVNCMCLCSPWVCQLSFRSNLPKAVHVPGVASLPGSPISRLSTPSVFACVRLELGFPRCLPHLPWEDASRGGESR